MNCKNNGISATRAPGRALEAVSPTRVAASDAERVANMPGNAAARRRAWAKHILYRHALTIYVALWAAAVAVSVVA